MRKRRLTVMLGAAALVVVVTAQAAAAQAVGNPPGNTLAPATGSVTTTPTPPPVAPTPDGTPAQLAADRYRTEIVCKTTIETGSLIARHKTCLTRKQWQYVNEANERDARKLVEDNTGKPGSN